MHADDFDECPVCGQLFAFTSDTVPVHGLPGADDSTTCPGSRQPWVNDEQLAPSEAPQSHGLCGRCGSAVPGPHAAWCDR